MCVYISVSTHFVYMLIGLLLGFMVFDFLSVLFCLQSAGQCCCSKRTVNYELWSKLLWPVGSITPSLSSRKVLSLHPEADSRVELYDVSKAALALNVSFALTEPSHRLHSVNGIVASAKSFHSAAGINWNDIFGRLSTIWKFNRLA